MSEADGRDFTECVCFFGFASRNLLDGELFEAVDECLSFFQILDHTMFLCYDSLIWISSSGIHVDGASSSGFSAMKSTKIWPQMDVLEVMEFESAQSNTTAKLPILKLGEYEMWVIRIKQYFQVQDYALWEVIENGNSWVSVPQTAQENGTSVTKMSVPVTAEEKTNKKNDVKARSLLLMALPNEHQLTFSHNLFFNACQTSR
ncbi:hypothetical protein Tco_1075076 [Tanacetum coccineum]